MKKQDLIGQNVIVGEPKENDLHNHSFLGTVVGLKDKGKIVSVEDQDGDVFDVDRDQVELAK